MIVIFCFSAQPAEQSSETSSGFSKILAEIFFSDFDSLSSSRQTEILNSCQFIVRKTAHFSIYCLLGILSTTACKVSKLKTYRLKAAIICLLYAISDEIHQYFVKGRSCEFRDVLIDFSGAITGILLITAVFIIVRKIKNRKEIKND